MSFEVKKARRQRRPLKISLEGLSGSGKTYTALRLAFAMRRAGIGKRIVVADSENESAGLYDGVHIDGETWQYETCAIPHDKQTPAGYAECYEYLVGQGFDLVVFDSLSHAWHGAMEQVDAYARANKGDKFGGWAKITPDQRTMLTTLTDLRAHCIVTMRVKSEYERTEVNGRTQIKKVGMKTDQRDNTEYEFDAVIRLDAGHEAHVEKVRGCSAMDNKSGTKPGPEFWKPLFDWWLSAEPVAAPLSPVDAARYAFAAAKSLAELGGAWGKLSPEVQARVVADKDRRKAELMVPDADTRAKLAELKRQSEDGPPLDGEGEQGSDPTARPASAPPAAKSNAPASASPAAPGSAASDPAAKPMPAADRRTDAPRPDLAGADIVKRIVALFGDATGLDWTQVRDDKLDAELKPAAHGGIAKHCGFAPSPTLKVPGLAPSAALRLFEALTRLANERQAKRDKRAANKAAKEGAAQ